MIPCILAYSSYDPATQFASECASEIQELLVCRGFELIELVGADANKRKLQEHLQLCASQVVCFLDYGHGNGRAMFGHKGQVLVEMRSARLLQNKICCVFACSTAKELGKEIVRKGGISFLGFREELVFSPPYKDVFRKCINSGVRVMVMDKKPIGVAFEYMKRTFDEMIDYLISIGASWIAVVYLLLDRDRLVLIGNKLASLWRAESQPRVGKDDGEG